MSEVAGNVETMVDETQEVSEKVGTAAEMETVSGTVQAYDRTAGVLTVRQEIEAGQQSGKREFSQAVTASNIPNGLGTQR